jgi:transcriptional regulator with XRE-family HTH domain
VAKQHRWEREAPCAWVDLAAPYPERCKGRFHIWKRCSRIPYMEALAVTVSGWLESSGLSAAAVARRAGVSASTMHRILNDLVDPSVGTLHEIALACGLQIDLRTRPLSDPRAAAAARAILEGGYEPPSGFSVTAWEDRLRRMTDSDGPMGIVKAAATASGPLHRPGAVLLHGEVALARVASSGDASKGHWAISGAAGLYLPPPSAAVPAVTILWCEDVRTVTHLLADTELRQTQRPDRAVLAVIAAEPELFTGLFTEGIVRYAAPIQIVLDCIAQGGAVADDATEEAMSW